MALAVPRQAELVAMPTADVAEAGQSQPTLDVLRRMATTLNVSADLLLFDKEERDPDQDLRLIFEAASRLDDEHKKLLKSVVEGVILRHDTRRVQVEAS